MRLWRRAALAVAAALVACSACVAYGRTAEGFEFADETVACQTPLFFEVEGFLTPEECDGLRAAAVARGMTVSEVDGEAGGAGGVRKNVRNSEQAWLPGDHNAVTRKVRRKTRELMERLGGERCFGKARDPEDFEDVQVVRYGAGGRYDPHYDSTLCGDDVGVACKKHQRVATLLVYLNDDFEGGATRFPNAVPERKVRPVKGKALFFLGVR